MKMEFRIEKRTLIARVCGELDMVVADEFRHKVDEHMNENRCNNLILNLNGVNFIDSSGLGVILGRFKKVSLIGGKMAIVGAPAHVRRILELSGVLRVTQEYSNEQEALQAM